MNQIERRMDRSNNRNRKQFCNLPTEAFQQLTWTPLRVTTFMSMLAPIHSQLITIKMDDRQWMNVRSIMNHKRHTFYLSTTFSTIDFFDLLTWQTGFFFCCCSVSTFFFFFFLAYLSIKVFNQKHTQTQTARPEGIVLRLFQRQTFWINCCEEDWKKDGKEALRRRCLEDGKSLVFFNRLDGIEVTKRPWSWTIDSNRHEGWDGWDGWPV